MPLNIYKFYHIYRRKRLSAYLCNNLIQKLIRSFFFLSDCVKFGGGFGFVLGFGVCFFSGGVGGGG